MIDPTITNSIIYGSIVGLMCVGLTVTYLTTKVPNFAVADFVVVGTYATAASFLLWNINSPYLALPIGVIFGGVTAVAMYVIILRPLIRKGSSLVVLMIATLAVDIVFAGIFEWFSDYMGQHYGKILSDKGYGGMFYLLGQLPDLKVLGEPGLLVTAPVLLGGVTVALFLLLTKTRFGIAMRAAIENANLARIVGVNVERVNLVSWFLAGGVAGLAGGLLAMWTSTPEGNSSLIIVDIFAGSVLGGLANIYGAIIGGLIVGASETYVAASLDKLVSSLYGPTIGAQVLEFQKGIPLAIMIIVLLFAPQGLTALNWKKLGKRIGLTK